MAHRIACCSAILISLALVSTIGVKGQNAGKPHDSVTSPQASNVGSPSSIPTVKVTTHLVTVDVVATDHHGQIVSGLAAKDFQVFEQIVGRKGQKEQKVLQFEFVTQASTAAAAKQAPKIPAGVYTNLITMARLPVPPTVLLVDGLNTDVEGGMQARRQMVKMLASIPPDTPVAVFLLGHRLQLLQGFTKDPNLLRAAAQKALSLDGSSVAVVDARDDPGSLSSLTQEMFGAAGDEAPPGPSVQPGRGGAPAAAPSGPPGGELQIAEIQRFEKETLSATVDMRVATTLDALRAIARHLSGYNGRKNLIWISSSFPLTISPDATQQHNLAFEGNRSYASEVAGVTNALADAKVAVYPVNPVGVQTQGFFDVSVRRSTVGYGTQPDTLKNTLNRENEARFASQESMQEVAQQTGGKICVNNNDLADCVKTAVTEGSSYYELAYSPDAGDWQGEFHRIVVRTARPGVELSFREGYYARSGDARNKAEEKKANDPQLQQAACQDLLTSTSVLLVARTYAGDQPGQAKFFLAIDSRMLTLSPASGTHEFQMDLAVCALDSTGKPLQYMQDRVLHEVKEVDAAAKATISHVVQFAPKPETARVRLVVRDMPSGRLGSVDIPYSAVSQPSK
jgi:VWFA-related protein